MRDRLQQSQLLDAQGMTTTLEQAYRQMWHLYLEQTDK
jgi:predicted O-linked N-acetylglucosamine transferase (SPINDLY family)